MRKRFPVWLGFLVSAVLLWWALRDADVVSILQRVRSANVPLMVVAAAFGLLTLPLRGLRWRAALAHLDDPPGALPMYHATAIGALANNIIPARMGELVAIGVCSRLTGVQMGSAAASLGVSHVFDIVILVAFSGLSLLLHTPARFDDSELVAFVLAAGALGALLAVAAMAFVVTHWREAPSPGGRVAALVRSALEGLGSLRSRRSVAVVTVWTALLWLASAFAWFTGLWALGMPIDFADALVTQTVVALGIALPSSPGFFGPFEAAARVGLSLYVLDATAAAEAAVAFHLLVFFFPVVVAGLLSVGLTGTHLSALRGQRAGTANASPPV